MITKPLLILAIVFNFLGINSQANNIDRSIKADLSSGVYGQAEASNISDSYLPSVVLPTANSTSKNLSNSYYYALVDGYTGQILADKKPNEKVSIASTTKIMSAVVALENYNLNDVVTVAKVATQQIPTVVNLRVGEKITVNELLHCLLIKSGNDSAYAIAGNMDLTGNGDIKQFVEKMNQKAKDLGMNNTHYEDPAGLSDNGYSTASDLAKITRYALQNETFRQIVKTPEYIATNTTKTIFHPLDNSNRLVNGFDYPGAIGVKTGFTDKAGHCLVGAAERNGHTLIAVVLNTYSTTAEASAIEARKLLDWGFYNVVFN